MAKRGEEWRRVPSLPWIEASSFGRVRKSSYSIRDRRGISREMQATDPTFGTTGRRGKYRYVHWRNRMLGVHQLVNEAFRGPPPFSGAVTRHMDDDGHNNTPGNLRWGTQLQNVQDRYRNRGRSVSHRQTAMFAGA